MKKFFQEFKAFATRGNVVDLAVGVIIGAAFQKIVTSAVNDLVMPLIGLITGTANFNEAFHILKLPEGVTADMVTSLAVAKEIDKISDISKIAVASGEGLADAVSVAAPAAQNKMPIILAHSAAVRLSTSLP